MQAVIYTRVSLNRNGGRSVEDQERECRAECERRGWPVRAVYCDNGISASRYGRHRPAWEECKKSLRPDDVLVLWEASRAQRDLDEWVRLRDICSELGVLVSYSGRVLDLSKGDDRFAGGLDALVAEYESERFKERVSRGKRSGALSGRPAGRVPWGYRLVAPGVWGHDPVEAPRIREAVRRILAGESHYSVWRWLCDTEGYSPPTLTVMNRALRSPTIAGFRIHKGKIVGKGTWEPIISEGQHYRLLAQHARLREARRPFIHNPGPQPKHLLSGIAKCGRCGDSLGWRKNRHRTPTYTCNNGHVSRLAEPMEELVVQKLFELLAEVNPQQFEDSDPAIAETWRQIEALEGKLAEWQEMALSGDITPQSFAKFEQSLTREIQKLKAKTAPPEFGDIDLASLTAGWGDLPLIDKRRIIRGFFTIVVHPSTQGNKVGVDGIDVTPLVAEGPQE